MIPYAKNGGVSRKDMSGDPDWLEITEEQYAEAVAGMAAGKLVTVDGGVFAVVEPLHPVDPEPEPLTLEQLKQSKLAEINWRAQAQADAYMATYPEFERFTWEVQRKEATAWQSDSAASTPLLDQIADARGMDRIEFIGRTLTKVEAFLTVSASLAGIRQRLEDQIMAATSAEQLEVIQWPAAATA